MNNDFNAKIKLLIKSEKALLSLELHKKAKKTFWISLALLTLLITLITLNITLFLYLSTLFSTVISGLILTSLNLILTLLFFSIASKQSRSAEAESIEEIRDFAYAQLADDMGEVKESFKEFQESAIKMKQNVENLTNGDAFGIKKFLPIVTTLIDIARKR